jgi:hypothetical protein
MAEPIKIFISYSWTTPKHEEWVINLADRLTADGIDVIIDKWNLKEGHDKYSFMESMVKSTDVKRVLMIIDKKYTEKADSREGGVGTETQIISPEIYNDVSQEKFIPIVVEKDDEGKDILPVFLKSRIYIDLSSGSDFEENYEKLIRNIFGRPTYAKPKIGTPPSYIFEDNVSTYRTSSISRSFINQYDKNPQKANPIIRDFLNAYYDTLKDFKWEVQRGDAYSIGKQLVDNLTSYLPLRNDFIDFLDIITKEEIKFDIDIIIRFFEKIYNLTFNENSRLNSVELDNYKFILHELFLYTIAIPLKNENYKIVEELLYSRYFIQNQYATSNVPETFSIFYNYTATFNTYYNQSKSQNLISPMADFIVDRTSNKIDKLLLIEADLLCNYIAGLNNSTWFPITYIYRQDSSKIEFFSRLVSLKHFEKVKAIFGVDTVEQLVEKVNTYKKIELQNRRYGYNNSHKTIPYLHKLIDVNSIGQFR